MASYATGALNLIAGQSTQLPPAPFGSPHQIPAVVIYNGSPNVVRISNTSFDDVLWPLTAQVYDFPGIASPIDITPLTIQTPGVGLGTVSAVYYDTKANVPPGFPLPLPPFPGGSYEVCSLTNQLPQSEFDSNLCWFVAVPDGTQSLTFADANGSGGLVTSVTGVQSGTVYSSGGLTVPAGGSASVSVTNPQGADTTFAVAVGADLALAVYASPTGGLPIPTAPGATVVLFSAACTNGQGIGGASEGEAWYLTGFDIDLVDGPDHAWVANAAGDVIAACGVPTAGQFFSTPPLNGVLTTGELSINWTLTGTGYLVLRGWVGAG